MIKKSLILFVFLALLLGACAPTAPQGQGVTTPGNLPTGPTLTPCANPDQPDSEICPVDLPGVTEEAPGPGAMPPLEAGGWQRVTPEGLPISFELPEGWVLVEGQPLTWTPAGLVPENGKSLFGVRRVMEGQEVEAALFNEGSTVTAREAVTTARGEAQRYLVEVAEGGAVTAYETHVVLPAIEGTAYDLFVSAPTAEGLEALQTILDRAVESLQ